MPQTERRVVRSSILLAHSDTPLRSAFRAILIGCGLDVIETADGNAAIAAFRDHCPDAVLLDASLPEIDGITACARIREVPGGESAIILVATESSDASSAERALAAGADDVVSSPLQSEVVRRRVLRLLDAGPFDRPHADPGDRHLLGLFEASQNALLLGAVRQEKDSDAVDFTILDINPAFERITGSTREALVGRSALEVAPSFAHRWMAPTIQAALTGESTQLVFEMPPTDRRYLASIHSPGPGTFLAIIEDVTAQYQLQEEAKWAARVDAAVAELGAALLASRSTDEISDMVLEQARAMTCSRYGFVGHVDSETHAFTATTVTPDIWDLRQVADQRSVFRHWGGLWGWVLEHGEPVLSNDISSDPRSGGTPAGHFRVNRFLGVPALAGGRVLGMIGLAGAEPPYTDHDLAATRRLADLYAIALQRLEVEDALRASESLSIGVIENSGDGIAVADEDGIVIAWNRAQAVLTGIPPEGAVGRPILELQAAVAWPRPTNEEHVSLYEEAYREFCRTGKARWLNHAIDREIVTPDGTHKIMQSIVFTIPGRRGFLSGSISRDVTQERRRERELSQSQRLESLGILAGGIAHEFNQVLTALTLELQLASRAIEPKGKAQNHMEKSIQSARRAAHLTQQLLAYSGKAYLVQAPIDVNEIVREQVDLIEPASRGQVRLELGADAGPALGDRRMIASGIHTLLANALQATACNGGEVRVSTARQPGGPNRGDPLLHTGAAPLQGPYVCIRVVDEGEGMDSESLAHCFEPFYANRPPASDLGISALLGIVSAHQGGLQASSRIGEGSSFAMWLPAASTIDHEGEE